MKKTLCHLCHQFTDRLFFCEACEGEILFGLKFQHQCRLCRGPLVSEADTCWRCRRESRPNFPVRGLFPYRSLGGEVLRLFKFEKEKHLSTYLAQQLMGLLPFNNWPIIPIASTNPGKRIWQPVGTLLKELQRMTGRKVLSPVKPLRSKAQKTLNKVQRQSSELQIIWKEPVIPERAILFDDVLTTGTTMQKIADHLRSRGVKDLLGLCICLG